MIIAVLNGKGGAGKTCLSVNLAAAYQAARTSVFIADSDSQKSALDWSLVRQDSGFSPIPTEYFDTPAKLEAAIPTLEYERVIIDGSAHTSTMDVAALRIADVLLIPVRPGNVDVWASEALLERLERANRPEIKAAFVVWAAVSRSLLAAEMTERLQEYGLPVLKARSAQRVAYAQTLSNGESVLDRKRTAKAGAEIRAIKQEVERLWRKR